MIIKKWAELIVGDKGKWVLLNGNKKITGKRPFWYNHERNIFQYNNTHSRDVQLNAISVYNNDYFEIERSQYLFDMDALKI